MGATVTALVPSSPMTHMYELTMKSITGEDVDLEMYRNTVCLIVNVASF